MPRDRLPYLIYEQTEVYGLVPRTIAYAEYRGVACFQTRMDYGWLRKLVAKSRDEAPAYDWERVAAGSWQLCFGETSP